MKQYASVAVRFDDGTYITTITWDENYCAHRSEPGLNQSSRVEELDCASPEGVGYFITAILKGDPIGTLEFLWRDAVTMGVNK